MRIRNLYAPKDIKLQPNVSVYEILTSNKLYDEVKETIYHLNIKYLPCEAILNKFAPNKQMSSKEKAYFLCELIKMCNPDNLNYNRELEEELIMFGSSYGTIDQNDINLIKETYLDDEDETSLKM